MATTHPCVEAGAGRALSRSCCFARPAATHAVASSSGACCSTAARSGESLRRSWLAHGFSEASNALRSSSKTLAWTQKSRRGCRLLTRASAYEPFPFDEANYIRAHLQLVQANDPTGISAGNLVFMKEGETVYDKDKRALVLSVGGDTLAGIAALVQGRQHGRPMSLDLLWQILARGQDVSKRDWRLVRVAIVALKHDVYYGRLFFGDSESGAVVWDCDCRPSDACWLSLKANCPVFIKTDVWEAHSVALSDLTASEEGELGSSERSGPVRIVEAEAEEDTGTALLTKIRKSDPEPVKRLKREMEVALREEDYTTATRIRDHPFMKLHVAIVQARKDGRRQDAWELEEQLNRAIQESDQARGVM